MGKLFKYIVPYRKYAVAAVLLMFLEVVMDLLQPTLMAHIVDQGVANGDVTYIIQTGLIMVGVALLGIVGGVGCIYFASIVSQNFGADVRLDLFSHIQTFSFDKLDQFKTSSLITRLTNDVTQVQNVVLMMLRMLTRFPLLFIGGMVMAFSLNAKMALVLVVTVPLLILSLLVIIKKGFPLFKKVQASLDKVNGVTRENLAGVRVVKAFVRSDYEKERFQTENDQLADITVKAARTMALMMPIMMLLMNLSIVAIIWFGGFQVNTGSMQLGEVIAFTNYMTQILFALMMAGMMLMMVSRAKVSADRIVEVMDTKTTIADVGHKDVYMHTGKIEFDHVSFQYAGTSGQPVLKDVTFSVTPGERIAILGSTGSGKSTLVHLLPRFYDVTEGRILLDGTDIRELSLQELRKNIGMVLQEAVLFSGTIRDNIRWGDPEASDDQVIAAAKAAQADEFIAKLPAGYDTVVGQRGVNLSGGQKQRLSIARALLAKPNILILDDSTSAVDLTTEALIQKALKEQLGHTTCIIVAQRISSVMEADKIIVLDNGQISDIGTHQELMQHSDVYQDIYRSQLREEAI
ncbi:multidrug ABC transporter ATP-binding protein [Brevibacillus laterosporus]|uniref:ABC transporter ATP-binding protein n=1 Tax=Brevibacillus laterosporus TaxID=1465 RepID=UPI000C76741B|nr:ABC transporter ATP-binding protein [Brevibacillus laterosporus]AUM63355.1 multidrug ABC transporter ATP-binding protein [Brevibacillus laterosporus]